MRRLLVLGAVLVACTGDRPAAESPASPTTGSAESVQPRLFVRPCESSVYGELGAGWRRQEVVAGPVAFVGAAGYADDPPTWFAAPGDRATSQKVLIVVDGARPVVVSVRHLDAALAYDPDRWGTRNVVPFRSGDPRVRFEPCGGDQRRTQFNGAFLLRGPACVPVEVRAEGGAPLFATLSFGAGDCP
jgi:hypothetical protein